MLQPFLFLGVGGSGGDTLRYLHKELTDRLRRAGITEMPSGWQFLHIDSRTSQEHHDDLPIPESPNYTYVGLVKRDVGYRIVVRQLENNDQNRMALASWRPDPDKVRVPIEEGAGQYRAIGRVLTIARLKHVKDAIATAVNKVRQAEAAASLDDVAARLGLPAAPTGQDDVPVAVVISSLAGGTGSGMFQDVCDLLRGHNLAWAADSNAILYAPDVFTDLGAEVRQGVHANALATISELLAGHWQSAPGLDPVHQLAGVTQGGQVSRSGPAHSFLVGVTNRKVSFRTQQEVFAAVGRTLAAWATSPSIQKQFSSYVHNNWQQAADADDPLGLAGNDVGMPFSALGYASVGLGRGVFQEYAGQCLARAVAERVLNGVGAAGRAGVEEEVRKHREEFIRSIGLGGDTEHPLRDVFDELTPPRSEALRVSREEVRNAVGTNPLEIVEWQQVLASAIGERTTGFRAQQRELLNARSDAWISAVQGRVVEKVVGSIMTNGLPVTLGLVQALIQFLADEAIQNLEHGATQDEQEARGHLERIRKGLGPEPSKGLFRRKRLFPQDNERVKAGLEWGTEAAFGRALDGMVRRRAAKMLQGLVRGLLKPLDTELTQGLETLRRASESAVDGKPSVVEQWPPGPGFQVPKALAPVRTQFLVDDMDQYPDTFRDLLQTAVHADRPGDAVPTAVKLIIGHRSGNVPAVLEQTRGWQPDAVREWTENEVEQSAGYQIRISANELLIRCVNWSKGAPALGPYIAQTLDDALGGDQPNAGQLKLIDRFAAQFEQALLASVPLVDMDPKHDGITNKPLISQIPLRKGTKAYERALQLLMKRAGLDEQQAAGEFNVSGPGEIEFTTFLSAPCHPIAFRSLTEPIQSDWQVKSNDPGKRAAFGKWRRARPLPRVVPLPADVRRLMVQGWFVGHLLKRIEVTERGTQVRVITSDGRPLSFPYPLLGEAVMVGDPFDGLAAVLESFPLVLVEPEIEERPAEWVPAYQELSHLGAHTDLAELTARADVAEELDKLVLRAGERLPTDLPLAPDRAWELRGDVRKVLETLQGQIGGRPR